MKALKPKKSSPLLIADHPNGEPSQTEIAFLAYAIWQREGCPPSHDVENWLQAEAQLRQAHKQLAVRA
ncbi:MAG: DUF2934 domain-containing protein [Verrucomicrobia bacterium]|nr:DUF2934 domain-containing protein [Verrucomicrobiota bacterium]